jgi:hypothetical protein
LGDVAAHRTVSAGAPDCPVRPSTAAIPNDHLVVGGYKYPNHHNSKHPCILNIAFNTRAIDTTKRHNQSDRSTQSPQINPSTLVLVRGSLVFLCCSCLLGLAFFFFSILTVKCFVSKARDTNCVVVLAGSK